MEHDRFPTEFSVGLSKEEYIRSQELLAKAAGGRPFGGNRWFSVVMVVLCMVMLAVDAKLQGTLDVSLVLMLALLVAVEAAVLLTQPRLLRKNSADAYDDTLFSGYSFDGILRVGAVDIRKRTATGETAISYLNCPAYVEAPDMMIFCANGGKSIVIPARCLTAEDAETVRAAAFAGVPANRRRLIGKLVPGAAQRLPEPVLKTPDDDPLLTVAVEYTVGECRGMLLDDGLQKMVQALPVRALFAVSVAVGAYLWFAAPLLPVFLLSLLLFCFVPLLLTQLQLGSVIRRSEGELLRLSVEFTEQAVHLRSKGSSGHHDRVPWEYVTRAVEQPCSVELYATGHLVSIPKRCVEDMETLRRVVDEHLNTK